MLYLWRRLSSAVRGEPIRELTAGETGDNRRLKAAFNQNHLKGETFMAHLNPLEKELLIRRFKMDGRIKLSEFCTLHNVSDAAFRKWLKQYEECGLEGLARASSDIKEVLPEGIDRTEEAYKREILQLRIENERLKKSYAVQKNEAGEPEYVRLKEKSLK